MTSLMSLNLLVNILTIRRILEGARAKKPTNDINSCRLYQGLRFDSQRRDGTNPTSVRHT